MNPYKAAREKIGMTQVQFAQALGCEQSTVSRWEAGATPGGAHLLAIIALGRKHGEDFSSLLSAAQRSAA